MLSKVRLTVVGPARILERGALVQVIVSGRGARRCSAELAKAGFAWSRACRLWQSSRVGAFRSAVGVAIDVVRS